MATVQKITPNLWFDTQAEQAAEHYVSIFNEANILSVSRYIDDGHELHKDKVGQAMTVEFALAGQRFVALNGGPQFKFTEAISFIIHCESQAEVDHFWEQLGAGGDPAAQQCGWLKDKFGVSWQVVPHAAMALLGGDDAAASQRAMRALLGMKRIDIAAMQAAYDSKE